MAGDEPNELLLLAGDAPNGVLLLAGDPPNGLLLLAGDAPNGVLLLAGDAPNGLLLLAGDAPNGLLLLVLAVGAPKELLLLAGDPPNGLLPLDNPPLRGTLELNPGTIILILLLIRDPTVEFVPGKLGTPILSWPGMGLLPGLPMLTIELLPLPAYGIPPGGMSA